MMKKVVGPRPRLLNPDERPLTEPLYGVTPEEYDKTSRLVVARIAGVGAALALGFLVGDLLRTA
jgi:hypothetical protein